MDFSFVLPKGVGITQGSVQLWTNTPGDVQPATDISAGPVSIRGRAVYAQVTGGSEGTDYQLRWTVSDTQGNVFERTGVVLCAQTS
jgi:hypothetical protein